MTTSDTDPTATVSDPDGVLCFTSEMHVAAEHLDDFVRLLRANNERARAQDGCRFLYCNQQADDPCTFLMYELWDNLAALTTQELQQPWMADYLAATEHMHVRDRQVRQWWAVSRIPDSSSGC